MKADTVYLIKAGPFKEAMAVLETTHLPQDAVDIAKEYTEDYAAIEIISKSSSGECELVWSWYEGL